MSEVTGNSESLNLREQIARIDRMLAEHGKFEAEQKKLLAEAAKFQRDRFLAPLLAAGAVAGAVAAIVPILLRSWGLH